MRLRLFLALFPLIFQACASVEAPIKVEGAPLAVHQNPSDRARSEAVGKQWVVSTQGVAATHAVREIYAIGGNMIDAAIAASFVISVERPQSTGIGGGGFLLYREARTGKVYAIDFRERAPRAADSRMFVDSQGAVIPGKSVTGKYASGVPGLVRGMVEIHRRFGKLPFERLVEPAIQLAQGGFSIYPYLSKALDEEKLNLRRFKSSEQIFFRNGSPLKLGDWLIQKDLAGTLQRIARTQGQDFYSGKTAQAIVKATGGWISHEDLRNYQVVWREPVRGTFRGHELISMPPPSSGGAHVIEILNILENLKLGALPPRGAQAVHWIASAMQAAFVDRARSMGDPGFVKVPLTEITSKKHAMEIFRAMDSHRAMPAEERARHVPRVESSETTHFSMMDAEGNMVASTQSINGWFGNHQVVPGTGVVLNNTMDDFAAKPGAQNIFGAVGSVANLVDAGKTPLSSMSPTFVLRDGLPVMAVGAPGGTRIITCVTQTLLNYLEFGRSLYDSVSMVRFHQQWRPDELLIEDPGLGKETEDDLRERGHVLRRGRVGCAVMAVAREGDRLRGVSDPRDAGSASGE